MAEGGSEWRNALGPHPDREDGTPTILDPWKYCVRLVFRVGVVVEEDGEDVADEGERVHADLGAELTVGAEDRGDLLERIRRVVVPDRAGEGVVRGGLFGSCHPKVQLDRKSVV